MPDGARPALRGLYAITPAGLTPALLLERVAAALHGGAAFIQYRDKQGDAVQRLASARALRTLCHRFGARLIINDDLALALAVDADGVHLGGGDGDLAVARQALAPGKLLGASCYADFERARAAQAAGADYVAFGALYPSPTKPCARLAPRALLARCRAELGVAVCAIGGITLANAPPLLAAGADLLAVISDLFEAPDIAGRAAAYQRLFEETKHEFTQRAAI
jgi:thiamine-phosphate pyrophosphorylase